MPWNLLLAPLERLPAAPLEDWYGRLTRRAEGLAPITQAMLGGRLAASPGLAFLAGYQAALRVLWPAAPAGLGALCASERRRVRPADLTTRLDAGLLHGGKDFVTAGAAAAWYLVAARDEAPGQTPHLTLCAVIRGAPGTRLEALPALPMLADIPHARLQFDATPAECLPGDGWDDYVKPFRSIEDLYVLMALVAWLYGVGLDAGWPRALCLRLAGLLAAGAELARHDPKTPPGHVLLAGLFAQFDALQPALDDAFAATPPHWASLWRRDAGLLKVAAAAREKRLDQALQSLDWPAGAPATAAGRSD